MKLYDFTAIDFETANHKRNSACSIGLVKVEKGAIVDTFYSLIKPEPNEFHPFNQRIHGISSDDVSSSPTFKEVFSEVGDWIKGRVLVAHNVSFEESVINGLYQQYNLNEYPENYICSLYMSRVRFHKHLENYKLPTVYYHLFGKNVNHHNALEDARACAEIALNIINDWQPSALERMADALYENGSPFITKKKKSKLFSPARITPEEEYEQVRLLRGNSFAFTGAPKPYTKHEAAQLIVNLGGTVTAGVTKSTTHLICGKMPEGYEKGHVSGKMKKALEMNQAGKNIQIVDATLFNKLVELWMDKLERLVH